MTFNLTRFLKGLLISQSGTNTPASIEVIPAGTASTKTTITSSQTVDQILTLPNATDTLVGKNTADILANKTLNNAEINILLAAEQGVTPITPATGYRKFYAKSGGFYDLNSAGVETLLGSGGGGANTALSNLAVTTLINSSLVPNSGGLEIGTQTNQWDLVHSVRGLDSVNNQNFNIRNISTDFNKVFFIKNDFVSTSTLPSSRLINTLLYATNSLVKHNIGISTAPGSTSVNFPGDINIETGNTSNLIGGDIYVQTGTVGAGGTRGKIKLDALEIDVSSKKITNLAEPTLASDAATRQFVLANAGGSAPNIVESILSTGSFSTVAPTNVTVTNLTVTITTTGKPVRVQIEGFDAAAGNKIGVTGGATPGTIGANVFFVRGGVQVNCNNFGYAENGTNLLLNQPPSSFGFTDIGLAAGTYVYTVQVSSLFTVSVTNCKLVAHELK